MKFDTNKHRIFFTSDTHYHHKNIVRGVTSWKDENAVRDFDTLEEMDQKMIKMINSTVGYDDILFHLGDWSFGGEDQITKFRNSIQCNNIYYIYGNHDYKLKKYHTNCFTYSSDYLEIEINNTRLILFHYPIEEWNGIHKNYIHLHGHVHSKGLERFKYNRMDVGLCGSPEFKPYAYEEVLDLITKHNKYHEKGRRH